MPDGLFFMLILTNKDIHNHFYEASERITYLAARASRANDKLKTKVMGDTNRAKLGGIIGQIKLSDHMLQLLKDRSSIWRGSSSENYKDIERAIKNLQEINCSVLGDAEDARASLCEEPFHTDDILSYEDKYVSNAGKSGSKGMASVSRKIPAEIPSELRERIRQIVY